MARDRAKTICLKRREVHMAFDFDLDRGAKERITAALIDQGQARLNTVDLELTSKHERMDRIRRQDNCLSIRMNIRPLMLRFTAAEDNPRHLDSITEPWEIFQANCSDGALADYKFGV